MKSFGLRLTGCRKWYFLIFAFSIFSKFQMTVVKYLMAKPSFFIMDFEVSYEVLLRQKYFILDLHTFDNETTALLKCFEISTEMQFVLFLLNERNITTSLLIIHLKCTVAHFANLNSSGAGGGGGALFMFILMRLLWKALCKNYHFLIHISKIHFKM